jgi:hypothetical protein
MAYYTPSGESEAVTVRPSATSLLAVDSDDRYANYVERRANPTYPFTFRIQKQEALLNGFFKRIGLTEFRLNWTLPNISAAWGNNVINFTYKTSVGATPSTTFIVIPDGFYDADNLASTIQGLLQDIIPGFVCVISDTNDDTFYFRVPIDSTYYFYFSAFSGSSTSPLNRQLIDMLNIPSASGTFYTELEGGIPNLRATDYIDIVCSQLTQNQNLRDTSSSSLSRDMIARIYLDDSVPSRSIYNTNYYSGTSLDTMTPSAVQSQTDNLVTFTLTTGGFTAVAGEPAVVSGITGGAGWNGTVTVVSTDFTASPFHITVSYENGAPTGTPSFAGTPRINVYKTLNQIGIPQTTESDSVNGVTPFVIYRQFQNPKQIRWSGRMPLANLVFELYDDQGRSIQDLWTTAYPTNTVTGYKYANSFVWNMSCLLSED